MKEIKITESKTKNKNIVYLYTTLGDVVNQINSQILLKNGSNRIELTINVIEDYYELLKQEIEDKIADIIAVSYKYDYFSKKIKTSSLSEFERELLITALIAADIDEDKKYVIKKLKNFNEYSIDGIFNFRMKPLKEKWSEVAGYIPSSFVSKQVKDFIEYIIKDKNGKKVYYENGSVFDKRYNILRRRELLTKSGQDESTLIEILLSGAGEVELGSPLSEKEEQMIKEIYGDRVIFSSNYYVTPKKS
jgi:hypothetical protein